MKIYDNILETIGNTPLVKLNKITKEIKATVLAKVETTNPGNSVKDRMAIKMIEDAEKAGLIKPGGTIIEGTSGNTGMGLALGAVVKGYKLICVLNDKQSKEKMDILRAVGAEVVEPGAMAIDGTVTKSDDKTMVGKKIYAIWKKDAQGNDDVAKFLFHGFDFAPVPTFAAGMSKTEWIMVACKDDPACDFKKAQVN